MARLTFRTGTLLALIMMAGAFSLTGCGPKKFDSAAMSDPAQVQAKAGSYWKKEGWWSLPKESGKKVAITEFTVQYVTDRNENVSKNQLGLMLVAEMTGVGKRKYEFDADFKAKLPTDLYNTFVTKLQAAGFEVLPMATVASIGAMDKVAAGEEGASKGMSTGGKGLFKSDSTQKGEIYSVPGLSRMYGGFMNLGEAKNVQIQGSVLKETSSDIALRVHMIIGLHKGQATVDAGSAIQVYAGLQDWGNNKYAPKVSGSVVSTQTIYRAEPVIDEKKFEAGKGNVYYVNEAEFKDAVLEIFGPYSVMAVQRMQD